MRHLPLELPQPSLAYTVAFFRRRALVHTFDLISRQVETIRMLCPWRRGSGL